MKQKNKSLFGFTEEKMADAFLELLQSPEGLPGIGSFDGVYREVICHQGRPDFIALRNKKHLQPKRLPESTGFVGPSILTLLKPKAPRTLNYLISRSEFSEESIKRTLRQLIVSDQVEQTETGAYRLGSSISNFQTELWVFELKLNNPKRAVFQAQQSCVYANRSVIVVPPGKEKPYKRFSKTLTRWGIGLATFDPINVNFQISRSGRKTRVICPQHQIYALSQIGTAK